jgi:hypothetical protein
MDADGVMMSRMMMKEMSDERPAPLSLRARAAVSLQYEQQVHDPRLPVR